MRVLLVEDKEEVLEYLRGALPPELEFISVENAADAVVALQHEQFDLAICDLKIPASADLPEAHKEHGLRVFDRLRADCPGTPIIVYSAYGVLDDMGDRLATAPTHNLFGDGLRPLVSHKEKNKPELMLEAIKEIYDQLATLTEIEVTPATSSAYLDDYSRRLVRIYARQRGGVVVSVERLGGGLSGAVTVRAEIETRDGPLGGAIVAKIADYGSITDERFRVGNYLGPLGAGAYASLIGELTAGAGDRAALFYALAAEYEESFFEVLGNRGDSECAEVVKRLKQKTAPWHSAGHEKSLSLADIRIELLSDDRVDKLPLAAKAILAGADEDQRIHVRWAIGHGDLHGGNVFVDAAGEPILIDFGRLGRMTAALDPITLELSYVLHPESPIERPGWPSAEQAKRWADLDVYLTGCPMPEFIRACRSWSAEVSRGDRERDATVFAFAVRQFRFPDSVNQELAQAYAEGALDRLNLR
jgi:CheY-like chemotaxis protein